MSSAMTPFELENEEGLRLRGLDFGATLTSLTLPVAGQRREVLLGCTDDAYPTQQVWLGAVAGRFANRIGGAKLVRDGERWPLDANQVPHCLHGGQAGFHRQQWQIKELEADRVKLALLSRSGDQGFPGNLRVTLEYRLEQSDLVIDFVASTDAATPVSLTSHTYFNLDGSADGGDVRDHLININADHFLPTDPSGLPLAITPVEGPFDLRHERLIGQDWLSHPQQQQAKGYDHALDRLPSGRHGWSRGIASWQWRSTPTSLRCSFTPATGWPTPRTAAACRTGITTASVLRRNSYRTAPIAPSWATPGCCRASVITTRPATALSATNLKNS